MGIDANPSASWTRPGTRAAGEFEVLACNRGGHLVDHDALRVEASRIHLDSDLSLAAPEELDTAHSVLTLEARLHLIVCELCELLSRARAAHGDEVERRGIGVDLLDTWRVEPRRKLAQDSVDPIADLLGGHVRVLLKVELHIDNREAFVRRRTQLRDARDAVDRLLQDLGYLALDLLRRRSRVGDDDGNDRDVDVREAVNREATDARYAEHHERKREYPGEDWAIDRDPGEPLHGEPLSAPPRE